MATSLPSNPSLERFRRDARRLQRAVRVGVPHAVRLVERYHPDGMPVARSAFTLSDAQLVVARGYGFASWPRLKHYLERRGRAAPRPGRRRTPRRRRALLRPRLPAVLGGGRARPMGRGGEHPGRPTGSAVAEHLRGRGRGRPRGRAAAPRRRPGRGDPRGRPVPVGAAALPRLLPVPAARRRRDRPAAARRGRRSRLRGTCGRGCPAVHRADRLLRRRRAGSGPPAAAPGVGAAGPAPARPWRRRQRRADALQPDVREGRQPPGAALRVRPRDRGRRRLAGSGWATPPSRPPR